MAERFDIDLLDDEGRFDIDEQAPHLFKHAGLGIDDIYDLWRSEPLFYPAKPPAHWLMVKRGGRSRSGRPAGGAGVWGSDQVPADRLL